MTSSLRLRAPFDSRSSSAIVDGFATGEFVARNTPSAQTYGVRPSLSGTSSSRAVRREQFDDVVRPAIGGAVDRRQPHRVHGVDVEPPIETELHGLEPPRRRFAEGLADDPVDAGRRHQRRSCR